MNEEFLSTTLWMVCVDYGGLRRNSVEALQGQQAGEEAADEEQEVQAVSARDGAAEVAGAESKSVDLPDGGQWQVTCDEDACEVCQGQDWGRCRVRLGLDIGFRVRVSRPTEGTDVSRTLSHDWKADMT